MNALDIQKDVEEFDAFLDKYTGKHEKDSWIKQTLYPDTVQVRKDLILKEFVELARTLITRAKEQERKKILDILDGMEDKTARNVVLFHLTHTESV